MKVVIARRVLVKHKEVTSEEIREAIEYKISWRKRICFREEIVGIGITKQGKFIEFIYAIFPDLLYVFHAQLATKKVFKELDLWEED